MCSFSTSDSIALGSAVVALSALGTSIWQGYLGRKHNRLGVKPHLEIFLHRVPKTKFIIEVTNHGLGPAIIQSINVVIKGESISLTNEAGFQRFAELLFSDLGKFTYEFCTIHPHSALAPNASIKLFSSTPEPGTFNFVEQFFQSKQSLKIEISYKCLYENNFKARYLSDPANA